MLSYKDLSFQKSIPNILKKQKCMIQYKLQPVANSQINKYVIKLIEKNMRES